MLDWMQELLGLPDRFRSTSEHGGGVIQGSASEAVLVAILAARWRATDGAVNADGDTSRLTAYCTSQAHSSIEKGLRIAGIGTDRTRIVDHDEHFAMRPEALAAAIDADRGSRVDPVFRVHHARHHVVDGVRPHPGGRRHLRRERCLAPRRRGDERDRRPRARTSVGQRRHRPSRQLRHQSAQVDGRQLRLHPVLDRRPGGSPGRPQHPARVPPLGGRRIGCCDRLPRLAGAARAPIPCAQTVVHDPPRRHRRRAAADPTRRRSHPGTGRRGSPPTIDSRSWRTTRSTCCACGWSGPTTPPSG